MTQSQALAKSVEAALIGLMKSSDTDILVIPGHRITGPNHWQSRMVARLSTARMVLEPDWITPSLAEDIGAITKAVEQATRPVVFVAHSSGVSLLAHAMLSLGLMGFNDRMRGAYLVLRP
jgi:uncharacterized protein